MNIEVDLDLCQGHAMCQLDAPEVFEVPKHGTVVVLDTAPPEQLHAKVRSAARNCPTQALTIVESP